MSIELIIGLVGAITGVLALSIQFFVFKSYMPKLVIKPSDNNFTFSPEQFGITVLKANKGTVIHATIINQSSQPITVISAYLDNDPKNVHHNDVDLEPPFLPSDYGRNVQFRLSNALHTPFRLGQYDFVVGEFIFPTYAGGEHVILTLETPRKRYSVKISTCEYSSLLQRLGNE